MNVQEKIDDIQSALPHFGLSDRLKRLARFEMSERADVASHAENVSDLARSLSEYVGFSAAAVDEIATAARWHDIGKLAVPTSILNKTGSLDYDEALAMRAHARIGATLLGDEAPLNWRQVARYHHERYDGEGYERLAGEDIPLAARIVNIADVHDALISERSYKASMSEENALLLMTQDEESPSFGRRAFDPFLLRSFVVMRLADRTFKPSEESRSSLAAYAGSEPMDDIDGGFEGNDGWHVKATGHRVRFEVSANGNKKMLEMRGPTGNLIFSKTGTELDMGTDVDQYPDMKIQAGHQAIPAM